MKRWLHEVANRRLHQTTREQPYERWQQVEQPLLLPLPSYLPSLIPAQPSVALVGDSQPLHHPLAIYNHFCSGVR